MQRLGVRVDLVLADKDLQVAQHMPDDISETDKSCDRHQDFLSYGSANKLSRDGLGRLCEDRSVHVSAFRRSASIEAKSPSVKRKVGGFAY